MAFRNPLLRSFAALCAVMLLSARGALAAGPADPATLRAVDAYLASERTAIGIPGLALVVVQGDQIVHLTAMGEADSGGRPITPQTPFLLASLSKAITATAVLQLVEAGRLQLDAPVRRYLPWFSVADPDAAARITLRELLNHTSGLSPASALPAMDTDAQDDGALERGVRALATTQLLSPPGLAYHYTNSDYNVLGLLVQTVSAQSFSDYVERHVFGPLDMQHSHATLAGAERDGAASGFQPWFGPAWLPTKAATSRGSAPSAMLFASAEDLGHELIAQLNGGAYQGSRVLSVASVALLQTLTTRAEDDFHGYAMGWDGRPLWEALDTTKPDPARSFQLPLLLEHGGSANNAHTYIGFVPAEHWGIALLVNANDQRSESRLALLEQNVLRILNGREPLPWVPYEEPLQRYAVALLLVLLAAELTSFIWSVRTLRRIGRADGIERRRRIIAGASVALVLDVLVVWLAAFYGPDHFGTTLSMLLRSEPDVALLIVPALGLAVFWGPVRTIALAWRLGSTWRRRQGHHLAAA